MRGRLLTLVIIVLLSFTIFVGMDGDYEVVEKCEGAVISVPSDYTTIQEAIDAATPGDILQIENGTYSENIMINKSLTLVGVQERRVFLTSSGNNVVTIMNNNVVLKNLNINGSTKRGGYGVSAVSVENSNITAFNCNFLGGFGADSLKGGAGLRSINSNITMINSTLYGGGCSDFDDGGGGDGLYSTNSNVEILNSNLTGGHTISRQGRGGCGIYSEYSRITINNTNLVGGYGRWPDQPTFPDPIDPFGGYGLHAKYSELNANDCLIVGGDGFDGHHGNDDFDTYPHDCWGENGFPGNIGGDGIKSENSNIFLKMIKIFGGDGGDGGNGGNAHGNGIPSVGGSGGQGGDGGKGIDAIDSHIECLNIVIETGSGGNGGNAGNSDPGYYSYGGFGGHGGKAGQAIYLRNKELIIDGGDISAADGGDGGKGGIGDRGLGTPGSGGRGGYGLQSFNSSMTLINGSFISGEGGIKGSWPYELNYTDSDRGPFEGSDGTIYCHTSYWEFINSSWRGGESDNPEVIGNQSQIDVKWFLHIKVTGLSGDPINNASVRVRDEYWVFNRIFFTNPEGYVRWITPREYMIRDTYDTNYNPYNITVTYQGKTVYADQEPIIDTNREINTTLTDLPPLAQSGHDQIADEGETVSFNGSDSYDFDGPIINYTWDFGDDSSPEYEVNPLHIYSEPGTFTVTLTVIDTSGDSDSDSCLITVLKLPNVPPTANSGDNQTCIRGELIKFDGSSSHDTDGTIVSYQWDFGDRSPFSPESNPSHSYSLPGLYNVTLTVCDDEGGMDNDTCMIEVSEDPFITLETEAPENHSIEITADIQLNDTVINDEIPEEEGITLEIIQLETILPIENNNNSNYSEDVEFILFGFEDTEEPVSLRKTHAENSPPVLRNLYSHTFFTGKQCSFYIQANDPDINDTLVYIDDSPLFDVDLETGLVSFFPRQEDIGEHIINFTVIDGTGNRDSEQLILQIKKPTTSIMSAESDEELFFVPFLMIPVLIFFIIAVELLEYSNRRKEKNNPKKGLKPEAIENDEQIPEVHNSDENRNVTKSSIHNSVFSLNYSDLDYQIDWREGFYDSIGGPLDMRISDDYFCIHKGFGNRRD